MHLSEHQPLSASEAAQSALQHMLNVLAGTGYRFTTTTPVTHQRVLAHRLQTGQGQAQSVQDVLGWNLPFVPSALPDDLLQAMRLAGVLKAIEGDAPKSEPALLQSTVRVSSLGDDLFVHSAFPTAASDAVFFGPDTYRFARLIGHTLAPVPLDQAAKKVLDIGCGTGAGGVAAVRALGALGAKSELTLNDINPRALGWACVNAAQCDLRVHCLPGDAMTQIDSDFDVIIANPPYLVDAEQRAYRHGGGDLGLALSLRMTATALANLAPGGQLVLYTGVAMVNGVDPLLGDLKSMLSGFDGSWHYSEIDPDVFGEELERPVYAHIDRIAAVGLVATRRASV